MKRNNRRRMKSKSRARTVTPGSLKYSSLSAREKATRERALNLLSELRRGDGSYGALLRKYHLGTRTARKYLGRNLLGGTGGKRVRASNTDRLVRELFFPMSFGDVSILTRNSKDATKLSNFFQDRDKLLRRKLSASGFEAKWRNVRIAGREPFADATAILSMADADVLKVETLYASVGAER